MAATKVRPSIPNVLFLTAGNRMVFRSYTAPRSGRAWDGTKEAAIQTSVDAGTQPEWTTFGFEATAKTARGPPGPDIEQSHCGVVHHQQQVHGRQQENRSRQPNHFYSRQRGSGRERTFRDIQETCLQPPRKPLGAYHRRRKPAPSRMAPRNPLSSSR